MNLIIVNCVDKHFLQVEVLKSSEEHNAKKYPFFTKDCPNFLLIRVSLASFAHFVATFIFIRAEKGADFRD